MNHVPDGYFFEFSNSSNIYAIVGVEISRENACVHIEYKYFSHNILRQTKKDWQELKSFCKSHGCKRIVYYKNINDNKELKKFNKYSEHFGFKEPFKVYMSFQEI